MKIELPGERNQWIQTNKGELSGNIWASWNLDLTSSPGKIRVSPQTTIVSESSEASKSTLVYPTAIVRTSADTNDRYWVLCNKAVYRMTGTDDFILDSNTGSPTTVLDYRYSDMIDWQGVLYVSGSTDIASFSVTTWTGNWWSDTIGGAALTGSTPHPICIGFNNLMLIGNGNYVATVDTSDSYNATRLTFPTEYEVTWIISSNSEYYIGCRNKKGRQGKVFVWDGYSENFNADYKMGSPNVFAGIIKDEICYIVNGNGQLMAFNGGGFTEVARFPITGNPIRQWQDAVSDLYGTINPPINLHKNGIALINNNIHIFINASLGEDSLHRSFLQNMLSGIWEYTPETGLYHKYSITKDTGSGITDYGSPVIIQTGALLPVTTESLGVVAITGKFYAGCQIYTQDGSSVGTTIGEVIKLSITSESGSSPTAKIGYFITPKIQASEVEENWQKLWVLIDRFRSQTDKLHIKYRTDRKLFGTSDSTSSENVGVTGNWATNSENILELSGGYTYLSVGDEVEILSGEGSGLSANITALSGSHITIDESVSGASGYVSCRFSNWKDVGTYIAGTSGTMTTLGLRNIELPINENSNWIQFKTVMFFTGQNEVEKLIIKSEPQLKIQ